MVFMLFEYKCLISLRNKICVLDINGDKFYKEKNIWNLRYKIEWFLVYMFSC